MEIAKLKIRKSVCNLFSSASLNMLGHNHVVQTSGMMCVCPVSICVGGFATQAVVNGGTAHVLMGLPNLGSDAHRGA